MELEAFFVPTRVWLTRNPQDLSAMPTGLFGALEWVARRQSAKRYLAFAQERGRRFDAVSVSAFVEELGIVDAWTASCFLADRGQRGWRCFRCGAWLRRTNRCDCGWRKPPGGVQWLEKVMHNASSGSDFARNVNRRVGQDLDDLLRSGPIEVALQHVNAAARELELERVKTATGNRFRNPAYADLPRDLDAADVDAVRSGVDKRRLGELSRRERALALLELFLARGNVFVPPRVVASLDVELFVSLVSAAARDERVTAMRPLAPRAD